MAKKGKIALLILLAFFICSLAAPLISPYEPDRIDLSVVKQAPDVLHPFGTDNKGRDILARVLYGGKISIGVSIIAALVSAFIGLGFGLVSGYCGGKIDTFMMAVVDFLLSFPSLLLAVAISVILPPGIYTVMIALAAVGWTSFARLIRGHVLTIKEMPFVDAARALGCNKMRIIFFHIAPLCIPLSFMMMGIKLGGFVLAEATLSFLGLGAQSPMPSWGAMISAHRAYVLVAPWMVIFPGAAISIAAFCFNILGESLKEKYEMRGF
jgi:ABC-type dipeptide/oligopeptide/nickel transport system permease subunit